MMRGLVLAAFAAAGLIGITAQPVSAAEHFVFAMPDNTFDPADITIAPGDTVTWENLGGFHNVNSPGNFRCANGCDGEGGDGDPASNNWVFSRTFDDPGLIDYQCDAHLALGMVGTVNVVAGGGPMLTADGVCPGDVTIMITGATPNGQVALLRGSDKGSFIIPGGPCSGVELGLSGPGVVGIFSANADGMVTIPANVPGNACNVPLQGVDVATCGPTNVARIPAP